MGAHKLLYHYPFLQGYKEINTMSAGLPYRHQAGNEYRYGFNGMEKDDEVKWERNSYDFGVRIYDCRVGRWIRRNPLEWEYPDLSPYNYTANNPIKFIDVDSEKFINPYLATKNKAEIEVQKAEKVYNDMLNSHEGKLKRKDIKKYKKTSGLNSAQKKLDQETKKYIDVEDYFYTLKVTNKEEYDYFENLTNSKGNEINIGVYLNDKSNALANTSNLQMYGDYTVGAKNNTIIINLYKSVNVPQSGFFMNDTGRKYNAFTNELGDIKYMFEEVKDKESYKK